MRTHVCVAGSHFLGKPSSSNGQSSGSSTRHPSAHCPSAVQYSPPRHPELSAQLLSRTQMREVESHNCPSSQPPSRQPATQNPSESSVASRQNSSASQTSSVVHLWVRSGFCVPPAEVGSVPAAPPTLPSPQLLAHPIARLGRSPPVAIPPDAAPPESVGLASPPPESEPQPTTPITMTLMAKPLAHRLHDI